LVYSLSDAFLSLIDFVNWRDGVYCKRAKIGLAIQQRFILSIFINETDHIEDFFAFAQRGV